MGNDKAGDRGGKVGDSVSRDALQQIQMKKGTSRNLLFAFLEEAACEGARCPTNQELADALGTRGIRIAGQSIPGLMRHLIKDGYIVVRIYGNNWRDVMICKGAQAGKSTMRPIHGGNPHTVIDASGRKRFWKTLASK